MDRNGLGCAIIMLVALSVLLIWGVISPRSMWMKTKAWQFKNPEANEPSDAAYSMTRTASAIGIFAILCSIGMLANAGASFETNNTRDDYERCLHEYELDSGDDRHESGGESYEDPLSTAEPSSPSDWDVEDDDPATGRCDYLSPEPDSPDGVTSSPF